MQFKMNEPVDVLMCDVLPFRHSTRTRKMALSIKQSSPQTRVRAVTLKRAGRIGFADDRDSFQEEGVDVRQVNVPEARQSSNYWTMLYNLVLVYPLGLYRLTREVSRTPSPVIVVGSTSLSWLGALHQRIHHSHCFVNARERLGGIKTKGSIGTLVSRAEPLMLRYFARGDVTLTSVCDGHADEFRAAGARNVMVLRNLPRTDFGGHVFVPPPASDAPLCLVVVGSLYPGRGLEPLICAVSMLAERARPVRLEISGHGSTVYMNALDRLASAAPAGTVRLLGGCAPSEVHRRYQRGHVGTALYEPVDAANDSLSNKLFESVASGRPVLASNLTENSRVVSDYGIGWVTPVDIRGLMSAIDSLIEVRKELCEMGHNCHQLWLSNLNWQSEVQPLVDAVLNNVSSMGGGEAR